MSLNSRLERIEKQVETGNAAYCTCVGSHLVLPEKDGTVEDTGRCRQCGRLLDPLVPVLVLDIDIVGPRAPADNLPARK
jgi:hypothetical protein